MDWLNLFLLFRRPARSTAASEIAGRCSAAVWDRIQPRVLEMSLPEARGYVRAKATEVIHAKADVVLRDLPDMAGPRRSDVLASATEAVVEKVIAEVRRLQLSSRSYRRAA